jgi:geranylgeranylglycerol-phosphate geranylgeranyltransferase
MQTLFEHNKCTKTATNSKSLFSSQLILLQSRKRWGIMYMMATITGVVIATSGSFGSFGVFGVNHFQDGILRSLTAVPATFLIITGMYVLNDLVDADLDSSSGKNRPIPSGRITKSQAWIFVIWTNAVGVLLVLFTFSPLGLIFAASIVAIGILYSAPKICLKERFILKTGSIAAASMLCLLLGGSYVFQLPGSSFHTNSYSHNYSYDNNYNNFGSSNPSIILCIYSALMSGSIIFVTSLLNDLGDVEEDKNFGRKTIPVVMGKSNTIHLNLIIASSMIGISWSLFYFSSISLVAPIFVSVIASLVILQMTKVSRHLTDRAFIRMQHKKSLIWHISLQLALVVGALVFWM